MESQQEKKMRLPNGFHPRNRHQGHYDFIQLQAVCPELSEFIVKNTYGEISIDFASSKAVKTLNRAILNLFYGISVWDIPSNYLCPPIPGRADYIHSVADLVGSGSKSGIPRGKSIRVLDIGVGANCIYPLIGYKEYGWSFVGSDIDPVALAAAAQIIQNNNGLEGAIELRQQISPFRIFNGIVRPEERFNISICNPPFHSSLQEAQEGTHRKWNHLKSKNFKPVLNFGGQGSELWCAGGELAFILRMIQESFFISTKCFWFTTLVSKESRLEFIYRALKKMSPKQVRTIRMSQGQKKSRIVAWTFLNQPSLFV